MAEVGKKIGEEDLKLSAKEFAEKYAGRVFRWYGVDKPVRLTGYHPNYSTILLSLSDADPANAYTGVGGFEPRHGYAPSWPSETTRGKLTFAVEDFSHLLSVSE